ncbi:MAG: tyrosine-type recombinase/integrase [Janthinobacterium lividum]
MSAGGEARLFSDDLGLFSPKVCQNPNNSLNYSPLLRSVNKVGKVGESLSDWAIWDVVTTSAREIGIEHFGAHDLRRTCAKLCRKAGGDLEQIKFLLGHSSIQTTERYLGSEQDIAVAVNDAIGL